MMKSDSSKETSIAKDKSLPLLLQDEVIVFLRAESGWLSPQFAAHPQMDADPIPGGKLKEHLLASCKGTQETGAAYQADKLPRFRPTKNPFSRMELYRNDLLAQAGVPLLAKTFDLGEFWHRAKLR